MFQFTGFPAVSGVKMLIGVETGRPERAQQNGNQPHVLQRSNCYSLINSEVPVSELFQLFRRCAKIIHIL